MNSNLANLFLRRGLFSNNVLYKLSRNSQSVVNYPDTNSLKIHGNIIPLRPQVKNIATGNLSPEKTAPKSFAKSYLKSRSLSYNLLDTNTSTGARQFHILKFGLAEQQIFPSKYIPCLKKIATI